LADDHDNLPSLEEPVRGETTEETDILVDATAHQMPSRLSLLEQLIKLMPQSLSFHEFMRENLLAVMSVIRCEAGSILEADIENQNLVFRSSVGLRSDKVVRFSVPFGQGVAGHVAEARQTLVIANAEESEKHLRTVTDAIGFETRNLIAVPIVIRGQIYGVLELLNRVGEPHFQDSDVDLVEFAAEYMAKTIECRMMINWAMKQNGEAA
jgi:sigma-B regulation protein RsbU (phosphoserine phosphatase)